MRLDPLSYGVVPLELFKEDLLIGKATGFFYFSDKGWGDKTFLVTNWHVLSGRNAETPSLPIHPAGAIPDRIRATVIGDRVGLEPNQIYAQPVDFPLYGKSGQAEWLQHQEGHCIDIAMFNVAATVKETRVLPVNVTADSNDMRIEVGNEVVILGYPFGYRHFAQTPVWKRGAIASEPNYDIHGSAAGRRVLVDATTRQGMSGAPVFMRAKTHYVNEAGAVVEKVNATRFLGVYAQRPILGRRNDDEVDAGELGYFFRSGHVEEIVTNWRRGPNYGEMP